MLLNERHHVHSLVQEHLRRAESVIHPQIPLSTIRAALTCGGVGLDHQSGEQAMAFADSSVDGNLQIFTLVTDRRAICHAARDFTGDIRFSEMLSATIKNELLAKEIIVQTPTGARPLYPARLIQPMGEFVSSLTQLPPEEREPPSRPLCVPTEDDPAGALQAIDWLGERDERTEVQLYFLDGAVRAGRMTESIARDLVSRVVLQHRTTHYGRGMANGRWVSAVSANDLSNAMVAMFGNPLAHSEDPVRMLEFPSRLSSNVGKAVVSSAIGLAAEAMLGAGWVRATKRPISFFRFMVADTGSAASFRVLGPSGKGLEHDAPDLLHETDVRLLPLEDAILVRRVARGWQLPATELLATVSEEQVLAELADGAVDSTRYRPAQPADATIRPSRPRMNTSDEISEKLNAAAGLMLSGGYEQAATAYRRIADVHPSERGVCYGQIGAAHFLVGRYDDAIAWYEAAVREGADASMMQDNIVEARQALSA